METAATAAGTASVGLGVSLFKTLAGLIFVLGCIALLAFVVRKLQNGTVRPGQLRLLGGLSVGPRERVMLIEAAGKQILIGVASGQVQALHVYGETAIQPAAAPAFEQYLQPADTAP